MIDFITTIFSISLSATTHTIPQTTVLELVASWGHHGMKHGGLHILKAKNPPHPLIPEAEEIEIMLSFDFRIQKSLIEGLQKKSKCYIQGNIERWISKAQFT